MTAIVVATIGGLGAILAGLVPYVLFGKTRRLQQTMQAEQALLAEMPDERTRQRMTRALHASTQRYLDHVLEDPIERIKRRGRMLRFPQSVALVQGVVMMTAGNVKDSSVAIWVGLAFLFVFVLISSTQTAQSLYHREERRRRLDRAARHQRQATSAQ